METEKLNILIVSDNRGFGKTLYDYFQDRGHEAFWIPDGELTLASVLRDKALREEALKVGGQGPKEYNGLIAELYLRDMTGFALAERVRDILEHPISAHLFAREPLDSVKVKLVVEAGCTFHLLPIKATELDKIIKEMQASTV